MCCTTTKMRMVYHLLLPTTKTWDQRKSLQLFFFLWETTTSIKSKIDITFLHIRNIDYKSGNVVSNIIHHIERKKNTWQLSSYNQTNMAIFRFRLQIYATIEVAISKSGPQKIFRMEPKKGNPALFRVRLSRFVTYQHSIKKITRRVFLTIL